MTRVGLVILRPSEPSKSPADGRASASGHLPPARGCIGTCTSTVLNALLERSFAAVERYEKNKKNTNKKTPITLVVPVTSQTKAEWGGGC